MANDYLVQEEDGTSKFTLEDDSGFILLEESGGGAGGGAGAQMWHHHHAAHGIQQDEPALPEIP